MHKEQGGDEAWEQAEQEGPGGLLDMPLSWLHQLVSSLPACYKLQLFRASRQLARLVVCTTPRPHLRLDGWRRTKQHVVEQLLQDSRELSVEVYGRYPSRFPTALASYITKLTVHHWGSYSHEGSPSPDWTLLTNLQELHYEFSLFIGGAQVVEKLAGAVGSRLAVLKTNDSQWLNHVAHFNNLRRLELDDRAVQILSQPYEGDAGLPLFPSTLSELRLTRCSISPGATAKHLFEHPALTDVSLVQCDISESCSHYSCHWPLLHLQADNISVFHKLPLVGIGEIRLLDSDMLGGNPRLVPHLHELSGMNLTNLSILPTPGNDALCLCWACEEVLPMVKYIRHACKIDIMAAPPEFMSSLWGALPSCVWGVQLSECSHDSWRELWQGLPRTVTHLWLDSCVPYEDLQVLWRTAPSHIVELRVRYDAELDAEPLEAE